MKSLELAMQDAFGFRFRCSMRSHADGCMDDRLEDYVRENLWVFMWDMIGDEHYSLVTDSIAEDIME